MYRFAKRYPILTSLFIVGGLVALALLRVFQVHEAGAHIPTLAGLSFGLPMFLGQEKVMTLEEVQEAVRQKLSTDFKTFVTEKLPEEARKATAELSDLMNSIKAEVTALKESMKPEDIAKKVRDMAGEASRSILTKMTKEEDEVARAIICAPVEFADGRNRKAKELYKEYLDSVKKTDYMNTGTGSEGGNIVPTAFANAVAMLSLPASVVLQDADVLPFPAGAGSYKIPTGLGGPAFYYPGEGSDITVSKGAFGIETMTPKLGACMVPLSRELMDFNNVGLIPYLTQIMGEASGKDVDYQIIAGGSSGAVMSAFRDDGAMLEHEIALPTFDITLDELLETLGLINIAGQHKWYVHPSVLWKYILTLKDDSGQKVFKDLWNTTPEARRLLGYPVRECQDDVMYSSSEADQSNKTFAFITDMKQSLKVAMPAGMRVETSVEASFKVGATTYSAFQSNMVLIKMARYLAGVAPDFSGGTPARYTGVKLVSKAS